MNDKLVQQIKKNFAAMETEALVQIVEERDNEQYSEDAFEAIKQILSERGQNVPYSASELKEIYDSMATEQLIEILNENDISQYPGKAFEVIKKILEQREEGRTPEIQGYESNEESTNAIGKDTVSSWQDAFIGGLIAGLIYGLLYAFIGFIEKNTKARMITFAIIFLPLVGGLKPFTRKFVGFIMMAASAGIIIVIKYWLFPN